MNFWVNFSRNLTFLYFYRSSFLRHQLCMYILTSNNFGGVCYFLTRFYKLLHLGMVAYLPKKEKRRKNQSEQLQQSKIQKKEKKTD